MRKLAKKTNFFSILGSTPSIRDNSKSKSLQNCRGDIVYKNVTFEYIKDKNLIIDASHNPNGILALKNNLDNYFPNCKKRFVFGCLKNKQYSKMMEILFEEGDEIYFNEFDYPNACKFQDLVSVCKFPAKKYVDETVLTKDKLNVICGSFYMIGQMKFLEH